MVGTPGGQGAEDPRRLPQRGRPEKPGGVRSGVGLLGWGGLSPEPGGHCGDGGGAVGGELWVLGRGSAPHSLLRKVEPGPPQAWVGVTPAGLQLLPQPSRAAAACGGGGRVSVGWGWGHRQARGPRTGPRSAHHGLASVLTTSGPRGAADATRDRWALESHSLSPQGHPRQLRPRAGAVGGAREPGAPVPTADGRPQTPWEVTWDAPVQAPHEDGEAVCVKYGEGASGVEGDGNRLFL